MTTRAVHWHEGMFLRPHHFQAAQRYFHHLGQGSEKWDLHYNWGLRAIDLDLDALAHYRLVVRSLEARLRDGTLVAIPEDGLLPELELKTAFEQALSQQEMGRSGGNLTVYLALPLLHPGRVNASLEAGNGARFLVDTQENEDENTGINPQPIQVRRLNLKLLLSGQDHAGHEVLPIARIQKSSRAEATPQLDETYFPPVLALDAWKPLGAGLVQAVYDRIGKKIETLASQVVSRGITFDSQSQGDPLIINQLRELNEAYALMGVQAFAEGVHPLLAYLELCRLVGQLAIFGATRRTPELPRYDHDDLGRCFHAAKKHLDALLNIMVEPAYKERDFVGAGLRMQVSLEPAWLEPVWQLYIGVQSPLEGEEVIHLLTQPGQLDMKVGSSDRVDTIFRQGQAGLRFTPSTRPPQALPALPGQVYFQLNRDAQDAEWIHIQKSLNVAVRLNESMIAGNIQGQRTLTIKTAGQTTTLQFTLYVMAKEGK